jgi:ADP-ribosylglycohydrolase
MQDKIAGSLFGMAFGDALAAPNEFIKDVAEIERLYGKGGRSEPPGTVFRVTDDTQMAIAVGEALLGTKRPYSAETLEKTLREAFITWANSPDNTRAPGMTCMFATNRLEAGEPWYQASVVHSKGCGANMRVAPVGVLLELDASTRAAIAQFQAAMTHGHPTALAASDLTAFVVSELVTGCVPNQLMPRVRQYAEAQSQVYHDDWLGKLWKQSGASSPTEYIERGWVDCLDVIGKLEAASVYGDCESDPCQLTGEGWVAEECFATGLLCFLLFPNDPVEAIRRAAVTSGDSDSIACLTGAFAGAYKGVTDWPTEWVERIEYRDRLERIIKGFSNA